MVEQAQAEAPPAAAQRKQRPLLKPRMQPKRGAVKLAKARHAGNTRRTMGPIVTRGFTAAELKDWMWQQGWSQEQLARRSAIGRRRLHLYLTSSSPMKAETRLAMLYATKVTPKPLRSGAIGRQQLRGEWMKDER